MKTVFITGGATGIGAAAVKKFLAEGWNVGFTDVNTQAAEALCAQADAGERLLFVPGDVCVKADMLHAVAQTVARFGSLNSVFTNAGIHQNNTILDISDEDLHRIMDINVFGTIHALQAALPEIIRAGGGSAVINCSDQWFIGKPNSFAYGMTKGALGQIVRSLSIDMGAHGIRVNGVCPGSIDTALLRGAMGRFAGIYGTTVDEMMKQEDARYLRGSMGKPEEVANLVFFLASDQASFCTGGHYIIDGGLVAQ